MCSCLWYPHEANRVMGGTNVHEENCLVFIIIITIWALSWENLSSEVCEQHRRRPACASAQSDQHLCFSLFGKYHIQTSYKRNFNSLASLCSWAGWFEYHFVRNPEDRFSRNEAYIVKYIQTFLVTTVDGCEQQRRRPACASTQSDQHLCYSLIGMYHI